MIHFGNLGEKYIIKNATLSETQISNLFCYFISITVIIEILSFLDLLVKVELNSK